MDFYMHSIYHWFCNLHRSYFCPLSVVLLISISFSFHLAWSVWNVFVFPTGLGVDTLYICPPL